MEITKTTLDAIFNCKNRIDIITLTELGEITQVLSNDPNVWVILLQANGDCFSAGVDVKLIGGMVGQDDATYRKNLKKRGLR